MATPSVCPTWPRGRKSNPGPRTRKQLRKLRKVRQAQLHPSSNKEERDRKKTDNWVRRHW